MKHIKYLLFLLVLVITSSQLSAQQASDKAKAKKPRSKKATSKAVPITLKGSKATQERDDRVLVGTEKLKIIKNDHQLDSLKRTRDIVPITSAVRIGDLKPKWRFCLRRVNPFLEQAALDFKAQFGIRDSIQINSAVRTVPRQKELGGTNCNAANYSGKRFSAHLTGAAIDIGKKNLTAKEVEWLGKYLLAKEKAGLIDATSEHVKACFHIVVFRHSILAAKHKPTTVKK